jgi:hypothetical protein
VHSKILMYTQTSSTDAYLQSLSMKAITFCSAASDMLGRCRLSLASTLMTALIFCSAAPCILLLLLPNVDLKAESLLRLCRLNFRSGANDSATASRSALLLTRCKLRGNCDVLSISSKSIPVYLQPQCVSMLVLHSKVREVCCF